MAKNGVVFGVVFGAYFGAACNLFGLSQKSAFLIWMVGNDFYILAPVKTLYGAQNGLK
jgi:hypothetical protein